MHVQNGHLLHTLRMSQLRYSTVVVALWSISLTIYKTTVVSQPHRHMCLRDRSLQSRRNICFVSLCKTEILLTVTLSNDVGH